MTSFRVFLIVSVLASIGGHAGADTFTLTDGRVLIGTVVKYDDSTLWIDTSIAGIRSTIPIERYRIAKHEKNDLTAEDGLKPKKVREPRKEESAQAANRSAESFGVVELVGVVGEDIFAEPIGDALSTLLQNNITTAVLLIDTPGGFVDEAKSINETLARYAGRMRLVAVVKNAISAGIWPTFACHDIFILPDGTFGGAVAYARNTSTGSFEVDAKFNSINAAEIGAVASLRGHSPDVVRAMTLTNAELYLVTSEDGNSYVSGRRPSEPVNYEVLDTDSTVVTFGAHDAARIGLATLLQHGIQDLPNQLELAHNAGASDRAKAIQYRFVSARNREIRRQQEEAERIQRYRKDLLTAIPALADALNAAVQEAESLDPNRYSYPLDITGRFTPDSRRNWRSRTDKAVSAWYRVGEIGISLRDAINDAERLEVSTSGLNSIDAKRFIDMANRRIAELRANWGRNA